MASKRTYRSVKVINKNYCNLTLNDALCPICRNILIEPVTLPCNHGFCYACFEGTVANANLTCPLCRVRFSSWHRIAAKENKIVNESLWQAVKKSFSKEVQNRLDGIDVDFTEETSIRLATPGDIRKEYELQRKKELLELERQRDIEAKASVELINNIKKQEELDKKIKEEMLRRDEEIARQVAREINESQSKLEIPQRKKLLKSIKNSKGEKTKDNATLQKNCVTRIRCQDNYKLSQYFSNKCNPTDKIVKNGAKVNSEIHAKGSGLNENYYFQPINLQNVTSTIDVVKVPAKRSNRRNSSTISVPQGKIEFSHNIVSAFATVAISQPIDQSTTEKSRSETSKKTVTRKRKLFEEKIVHTTNKNISEAKTSIQTSDCSPSKIASVRKSNRLQNLCATSYTKQCESPPFYGFELCVQNSRNLTLNCDVLSNNNVLTGKDAAIKKMVQEKSDLEFARKLQDQLNKAARYSTRSSISRDVNSCKKQRQIKLDEIIKCRNKVK